MSTVASSRDGSTPLDLARYRAGNITGSGGGADALTTRTCTRRPSTATTTGSRKENAVPPTLGELDRACGRFLAALPLYVL